MSSSNNDTHNNVWSTIFDKIKEKEVQIAQKVIFCFIFVGIFTKVIFSNINSGDPYGNNGPATVNIMSYSLILFSLIILVFSGTIIKMHNEKSSISSLESIKGVNWDTLAIVIYLFWIISININYYKNINLRRVPPNFYLYSNLTHIIISFQLVFYILNFILFSASDSEQLYELELTNIKQKINILNYLLIFLNFFLILIQQIILENFTVDIA